MYPFVALSIAYGYFSTTDEAQKVIEENYAGCHESLADFVEELTDGTTEIPESLAYYIDYEKMGRDIRSWAGMFSPLRLDTKKFTFSGITNC